VTAPQDPGPTLTELLSDVAARSTAPGAGVVTAVAIALAAALAAMGARFAEDEAATLADRAEELTAAAMSLSRQDPAAYRGYLQALRSGATADQVSAALDVAVEIPLRLAQTAADTATVAARLVQDGNPRLRGDCVTAVLLAAASARAAAVLVSENLRRTPDDARVVAAGACVARANAAEASALDHYPDLRPAPPPVGGPAEPAR